MTLAAELCSICTGFKPEAATEQTPYWLHDFDQMRWQAAAGCGGCQFFWDVIKNGSIEDFEQPGLPTDSEDFAQLAQKICILNFHGPGLDLEIHVRLDGGSNRHRPRVDSEGWTRSYHMSLFYEDNLGAQNSDASANLRFNRSSLVAKDAASDECIGVASRWLQKCEEEHEGCGRVEDVQLPSRLIFIPADKKHPLQLQNTSNMTGKYVALSHCWGLKQIIKTTENMLLDHRKQISFHDLSRTFQDAVILSRKLGFKYIWIDSLCIIQDSPADWAQEASRMANIYGNATLILSAAAAPDGDYGMLNQRSITRSPLFDSRFRLQGKPRWDNDELMLMPLSHRAWTFQERIMGRRVLHFLRDQLLWECDSGAYLEDSQAIRVGGSVRYLNKRDICEFLNRSNTPSAGVFTPQTRANEDHYIEYEKRTQIWCECVSYFTPRELTYTSDKLPALSGLAFAFDHPSLGTYLSGLWEGDIFRGLAWTAQNIQRPEKYLAPSWSWASCMSKFIFVKSKDSKFVSRDQVLNASLGGLGWDKLGLWPDYLWDPPLLPEKDAYTAWAKACAPVLLEHDMRPATSNPRGELLPGSSITIFAFCRDFYSDSTDSGPGIVDGETATLFLDVEDNSRSWHLEQPQSPSASLRTHVGAQIAKNKSSGQNKPRYDSVWILLLEAVRGEESTFRRIGIMLMDPSKREFELEPAAAQETPKDVHDGQGWQQRRLKLI